jgi:branched-chain amino acid transport system ATP-binding protein
MSALLSVTGITVRFGGVTALKDAGFDLQPGELLGLLGPNGAGKTTMMRSITGVVIPQAGEVILQGRTITALPTHKRVRLGLGMSQQIVRPFRSMSILDNVALAAGHARTASPLTALVHRQRSAERERAGELLARVGIAEMADAEPSSLPLGMLKRLEVARALALDPKLLLLDEPLAGLNHLEAGRLADIIVALNQGGLSIILIEHNLSEVLRICQRLVVLDNGRNLATGEPRAVMDDPAVRAAYLGTGVSSAGETADA